MFLWTWSTGIWWMVACCVLHGIPPAGSSEACMRLQLPRRDGYRFSLPSQIPFTPGFSTFYSLKNLKDLFAQSKVCTVRTKWFGISGNSFTNIIKTQMPIFWLDLKLYSTEDVAGDLVFFCLFVWIDPVSISPFRMFMLSWLLIVRAEFHFWVALITFCCVWDKVCRYKWHPEVIPFNAVHTISIWKQFLGEDFNIFYFLCKPLCSLCLLPQTERRHYGNLLCLFAHHLAVWGSWPKWLSGCIYFYCVCTFGYRHNHCSP